MVSKLRYSAILLACRLGSTERPARQLAAGLQGKDGVGAAGIGDEVAAVVDRGLRKPLAALALIRANPIDAAPQSRVVRRDVQVPAR